MATRENLRTLHFHKVCGGNIKILTQGKVAHRSTGFNDGLTFTNRPVLVGERIFLKIEEITKSWSGAFRLGFTINDPVSMKDELPVHACPDFVSIPGNWAKALPEALNKVDSLISFFVDKKGDVYYQHDDKKEKLLLTKVDTKQKMWGVIDIYGNTVKVELVPDPNKEYSLSDFDLTFHYKHGLHIKLDDDKLVASREGGMSCAYVFSCKPMQFDEKVIVKVMHLDPFIEGSFVYGLTSCDPSNLQVDALPKDVYDLYEVSSDYWIHKFCPLQYKSDDIVTFTLCVDGIFIVTRNANTVSSKLHVDTSRPLWLFIKLSGAIDKVCMMGTSEKRYPDLVKEFKDLAVSSMQEVENTKQRMSRELIIGECVICCDKPVDCTLYRCGHMCMCYKCGNKMLKQFSNCPVCRMVIEDVIKVYT